MTGSDVTPADSPWVDVQLTPPQGSINLSHNPHEIEPLIESNQQNSEQNSDDHSINNHSDQSDINSSENKNDRVKLLKYLSVLVILIGLIFVGHIVKDKIDNVRINIEKQNLTQSHFIPSYKTSEDS